MFAQMFRLAMYPMSQNNFACVGKGGSHGAEFMMRHAIEMLKQQGHSGDLSKIAMIGDRFDTDIKGALSVGIKGILVESGAHKAHLQANYSDYPATWVAPSIDFLHTLEVSPPAQKDLTDSIVHSSQSRVRGKGKKGYSEVLTTLAAPTQQQLNEEVLAAQAAPARRKPSRFRSNQTDIGSSWELKTDRQLKLAAGVKYKRASRPKENITEGAVTFDLQRDQSQKEVSWELGTDKRIKAAAGTNYKINLGDNDTERDSSSAFKINGTALPSIPSFSFKLSETLEDRTAHQQNARTGNVAAIHYTPRKPEYGRGKERGRARSIFYDGRNASAWDSERHDDYEQPRSVSPKSKLKLKLDRGENWITGEPRRSGRLRGAEPEFIPPSHLKGPGPALGSVQRLMLQEGYQPESIGASMKSPTRRSRGRKSNVTVSSHDAGNGTVTRDHAKEREEVGASQTHASDEGTMLQKAPMLPDSINVNDSVVSHTNLNRSHQGIADASPLAFHLKTADEATTPIKHASARHVNITEEAEGSVALQKSPLQGTDDIADSEEVVPSVSPTPRRKEKKVITQELPAAPRRSGRLRGAEPEFVFPSHLKGPAPEVLKAVKARLEAQRLQFKLSRQFDPYESIRVRKQFNLENARVKRASSPQSAARAGSGRKSGGGEQTETGEISHNVKAPAMTMTMPTATATAETKMRKLSSANANQPGIVLLSIRKASKAETARAVQQSIPFQNQTQSAAVAVTTRPKTWTLRSNRSGLSIRSGVRRRSLTPMSAATMEAAAEALLKKWAAALMATAAQAALQKAVEHGAPPPPIPPTPFLSTPFRFPSPQQRHMK
eukprot:gnl/MRDRNA2_/MRDRNA2_78799_c0_seq1.p1 gnl/MRDRNA2_/MRDRNA2_78799_c0~~gnl/MRDRNA2_/MRDRNA2_78799_c0_seq1.p1  ORF type:complete len:971 (+),score=171.25 gnl/MRDRNA2_/MRDRNA2_78799_c0_seq1:414-2915(+)